MLRISSICRSTLPFRGEEAKYSPSDEIRYQKLLTKTASVVTISADGFSNQAYHQRNDFLIDNAPKLIAYHNGNLREVVQSLQFAKPLSRVLK